MGSEQTPRVIQKMPTGIAGLDETACRSDDAAASSQRGGSARRSTAVTSSKPPVRSHDIVPRLRIRLYLAGESPNSMAARANLRAALQQYPERQVDLEIIDVLNNPERGMQDQVLVTPMLVKVEPPPARRVLGSLSNCAALVGVLGLEEELHG